jgi:hypothetical protein
MIFGRPICSPVLEPYDQQIVGFVAHLFASSLDSIPHISQLYFFTEICSSQTNSTHWPAKLSVTTICVF